MLRGGTKVERLDRPISEADLAASFDRATDTRSGYVPSRSAVRSRRQDRAMVRPPRRESGGEAMPAMVQTLEFVVVGENPICCAACEQRIGKVLRRLFGVLDVRASAHTQRVAVTIDRARVQPDQLRAKLEQMGYQVVPEGGPARASRPASVRTSDGAI
jgi:copper chaperone